MGVAWSAACVLAQRIRARTASAKRVRQALRQPNTRQAMRQPQPGPRAAAEPDSSDRENDGLTSNNARESWRKSRRKGTFGAASPAETSGEVRLPGRQHGKGSNE